MKRKAFNFYYSYFDVWNELSDKDKVAFMDALLKRQFWGVEPEKLSGTAKFAYISQRHSIDAQVQGYKDKTDSELAPPSAGGSEPPSAPPSVQGKGKGEDKGKEEEKGKGEGKDQDEAYTVEMFLEDFNMAKTEIRGKASNHRTLSDTTERNFLKLQKKGYLPKDFGRATLAMLHADWPKKNGMDNPTHLLVEDNFLKYISIENTNQLKDDTKPSLSEQIREYLARED
jgi:hypothetical protein